MVGLEDDAAAAPAIAAAGAALGTENFAQESDAPFAAMAGPRIDFYFINEHRILPVGNDFLNKKGEA